jgi:trk system potassium uptake protein TrkH
MNKIAVDTEVVTNVLAFLALYVVIVIISMVVMSALGNDLETSIGAVAATLGNIGPGIGNVGPADNFNHIAVAGKWFLSFLMLVGRLELFTVLVLFSPAFWKK